MCSQPIPSSRERPAATKSKTVQERLNAVRSRISNRLCADCSVAKAPVWAVTYKPGGQSMGLLCCNNCCAHHRELVKEGLFEIKSVEEPDQWTTTELAILEQTGNKAANEVYEAKLGGLKDGARDRFEQKRQDDMLAYLLDKYQRRLFFSEEAYQKVCDRIEKHRKRKKDLRSKSPRRAPASRSPTRPTASPKRANPVGEASNTLAPRRQFPSRAASLREMNPCRSRSPIRKMKSDLEGRANSSLASKDPANLTLSKIEIDRIASTRLETKFKGSPFEQKGTQADHLEAETASSAQGSEGSPSNALKSFFIQEDSASSASASFCGDSVKLTSVRRTVSATSSRDRPLVVSDHGRRRAGNDAFPARDFEIPFASRTGMNCRTRVRRSNSNSSTRFRSRSSDGSYTPKVVVERKTALKEPRTSGVSETSAEEERLPKVISANSTRSVLRGQSSSHERSKKSSRSKSRESANIRLSTSRHGCAGTQGESSSELKENRPRLDRTRSSRSNRDVIKRIIRSRSHDGTKQSCTSSKPQVLSSSTHSRTSGGGGERSRARSHRAVGGLKGSRSSDGTGQLPLAKESGHRAPNDQVRKTEPTATLSGTRRRGLVKATSERKILSQRIERPKRASREQGRHREQLRLWNSVQSFASFTPHDDMLSRIAVRNQGNLRTGGIVGRHLSYDDSEVDNARRSVKTEEADFDGWDVNFSDDEGWDAEGEEDEADDETSDEERSPSDEKKSKSWKKKLVKKGRRFGKKKWESPTPRAFN